MVSKKYKLRLYSILGICELVLAGLKFGLPKKRSVLMQVSYINWSIRFFINFYQNFSSFSLRRCSQTWTFSCTSLWKNMKDGADQDYVIEAFSMCWSTDQNHIFLTSFSLCYHSKWVGLPRKLPCLFGGIPSLFPGEFGKMVITFLFRLEEGLNYWVWHFWCGPQWNN